MKAIKIMHVVHSLRTGGMENGVVNLINRLDQNQFLHSVCCISRSGDMEKRIKRKDVKIFEMKKKEGHSFSLPLRLATLFRKEGVDIVHTRNWGTIDGILGARLACITRVLHGEHGREARDPEGLNKKRNFLRRALNPFVSCYIAVSQDLKRWLIDLVGIKDNKVTTIINGVDIDKFYPTDSKEKNKKALGYSPEEIIIGAVGRLDPVKDYITLIKAFASLSHIYRNIKLIVIGNGPEESNLKRLVEQCEIKGKVAFLGRRDETPELFRAMDIYVLPSVAEGISNTILEAMASGLPVVTTKVGGNPELVNEGETGFIFTPGDVDCLITLIKKYVEHPYLAAVHGEAGRKKAVEEFSLDRMIKSYENLYMRLAGRTYDG